MPIPLVALGLAAGAAQMGISNASEEKRAEAEKERNEAIERENRKNAIARALGAGFTGSARKMPTGKANTSLLDTIGGLAGVGSSLAFRGATARQPSFNAGDSSLGPASNAITRANSMGVT